MARDLTGIESINEFFSEYYLSTHFEEAIKEALAIWEEDGEDCGNLLYRCAQEYYKTLGLFEETQDVEERLDLTEEAVARWLDALAYPVGDEIQVQLDDGLQIPVFRSYDDENGRPVVQTILVEGSEEEDLFSEEMSSVPELTIEEAITRLFFEVEEPPRFILLTSLYSVFLLDRTKWSEKKALCVDMRELFVRHDRGTAEAVAAILSWPSLVGGHSSSLIDRMERRSRENAVEVSQALSHALRLSIELLGNEVLYDRRLREEHGEELTPTDPAELSIECLRYLYRLLFLLFIEARPELGFAPIKSPVYRSAYSLEALRDIAEGLRPTLEFERDTTYLADTLNKLCELVYGGYPTDDTTYARLRKEEHGEDVSLKDVFTIPPLKAHLFDNERTKLVSQARLRDSVMLHVIDALSISKPRSAKERAHRISYGTLGINQLGAVYEGLLSYRGFIAQEDLYEVKKASKSSTNDLDVGYFVTASQLESYGTDERVYDKDENGISHLRVYPKGSFIYRLAGRDRERSASYYTPESLTDCLVREGLRGLLEGKSSEEILELTICEPAMGSAAFLNAAVSQLAAAYLEKAEQEKGEPILLEKREEEYQRVKMYIADRNVYGIDLNPVATELAEVSLWLNAIGPDGHVPWFGTQLHTGNSLVGARREGYTEAQLTTKTKGQRWYDNAPESIKFKNSRGQAVSSGQVRRIYHFLTDDPGMAEKKDKVALSLVPGASNRLNHWKRQLSDPYTQEQIGLLRQLSATVDRLWAEARKQQREVLEKTRDAYSVFEHKDSGAATSGTTREKDAYLNRFYRSEHQANAGAYARLKFAMDYWCALWFWPLEELEELPSRSDYLMDMKLILGGTVDEVRALRETVGLAPAQGRLFDDFAADEGETLQLPLDYSSMEPSEEDSWSSLPEGTVDLDQLCTLFPRLSIVRRIASEQRFFHWDLEFADLLWRRGGFDLVIGNPPWVKLEWKEGDILSEADPSLAIRNITAPEMARRRGEALEDEEVKTRYLQEYTSMAGLKNFLNAAQTYPMLKKCQANLYKPFLPQAFGHLSPDGVACFVHPTGIWDDPKGGELRRLALSRVRRIYQFSNELRLFAGVHHETTFSLSVYGSTQESPHFYYIANLFDPTTIKACWETPPAGPLPGIKDDEGRWDTRGNKDRIVEVTKHELSAFARLFEDPSWRSARLLFVQGKPLLASLLTLIEQPRKVRDLEEAGELATTECWHETNAVKDGIIKPEIGFPANVDETIYSSPFIGLANPLYQTTRPIYRNNSDYDFVDLTNIGEEYRPRTKYKPAVNMLKYKQLQGKTPWGQPFDKVWWLANREYVGVASERTLQSALLPPGTCWINKVFAYATPCLSRLFELAGYTNTLPLDFLVRSIGKADVNYSTTLTYPLVDSPLNKEIAARALLLNCLTRDYEGLWHEGAAFASPTIGWSKQDKRLDPQKFERLGASWIWDSPLRTHYERRQALVELDVLAAMALGLSLDQLKDIYRVSFGVLRKYESDTWYDRKGRVAFSCNNQYSKVSFGRNEFDAIKDAVSGTFSKIILDTTHPGEPQERTVEFEAPFDLCNREKDYETAWGFFVKHYGLGDAK